jgi:hypothetical protein
MLTGRKDGLLPSCKHLDMHALPQLVAWALKLPQGEVGGFSKLSLRRSANVPIHSQNYQCFYCALPSIPLNSLPFSRRNL